SSAWLERCVRDAEAASSNLAAPTRQTGQERTVKWALSLFSVAHLRTSNQAAAYTYPENPTPKGVRRGARACDREAPAPRAPPSPSRLPRTDAENPGAAAPPKGPPHPKAYRGADRAPGRLLEGDGAVRRPRGLRGPGSGRRRPTGGVANPGGVIPPSFAGGCGRRAWR